MGREHLRPILTLTDGSRSCLNVLFSPDGESLAYTGQLMISVSEMWPQALCCGAYPRHHQAGVER